MTLDTIKTILDRRPFVPVRIKTTNGDSFDIRHPEMVMFAKSALCILAADSEGLATDRIDYISYLHVTGVETTVGEAA